MVEVCVTLFNPVSALQSAERLRVMGILGAFSVSKKATGTKWLTPLVYEQDPSTTVPPCRWLPPLKIELHSLMT